MLTAGVCHSQDDYAYGDRRKRCGGTLIHTYGSPSAPARVVLTAPVLFAGGGASEDVHGREDTPGATALQKVKLLKFDSGI